VDDAGGPALRFRRNVLLLWGGQFVSATGDALFLACLQWLAYASTRREDRVGLAVFVATLPALLLGPFAGAWADRFDRRRLMIASDLLRAGLLIPVPFLVAAGGALPYGALLAVAFALGSLSSPFLPARDALLPALVEGRSLTRWNAALQTSSLVAAILGLAAGGALLAGARYDEPGAASDVLQVIRYDGATFLVSALALAFVVVPGAARGASRPARRFLHDVADGLRYARRDRVVRPLLVLTALDNLAIMGPATVGATLWVTTSLGLGAGELAWFEGAMAVGMLVGSLWLARHGPRWRAGALVPLGMLLDGLTYLPFAFLSDFRPALLLIALHGFFIPFIVVGRTSLLQSHVPEDRRGKVFALVATTVTGMTAVSALASGWIARATSPQALFAIAGTFGAVCGVGALAWWRGVAAETTPPRS
jgi:DHA3 family macrolide efflux protein-like MFS transporter